MSSFSRILLDEDEGDAMWNPNPDDLIVSESAFSRLEAELDHLRDRAKYYADWPRTQADFCLTLLLLRETLSRIRRTARPDDEYE